MFIGIALFFIGILLQIIGRLQSVKGNFFSTLHKPWVGLSSAPSIIGIIVMIIGIIFIYLGYDR